jgi:putative membrane-bound dehydrogenase-like protein
MQILPQTCLVGFVALGATLAFGQGFSPDEAVRQMRVADGLEVELVAAEPHCVQPVAIEFDDRGRLWVIQYLQYPNPAGLVRVSVDRYSRTKYDRIPEPPPNGPVGSDRVTILIDSDLNGVVDQSKDFLTGLNLASGLAFGNGGVYLLNVPYLLFYADRNADDVPDGPPDVLLSGFGMEDAHSVANSLTWGPDGWLYGCQGSTVTSQIRGIEFQQGVWRYHPSTDRFELFCEGGGNSWGLDFDARGELFYSTNVGGYAMLHGVPGGYYWKSFGKHGALHNPFAFGYFDHVPHAGMQGGHVTVGGMFYQGTALPGRYHGAYIAGDLLGHAVRWHRVTPDGSTFRAEYGGELLTSSDTWFAPCDLTIGPDGFVYVADWHDRRMAHPDPDAEWDRSNGRIFRIKTKGAKAAPAVRLDQEASSRLLSRIDDPNEWIARRARRLLTDRRDPQTAAALSRVVRSPAGERQLLAALWTLLALDELDDSLRLNLLGHENATVRSWAVRSLPPSQENGSPIPDRLAVLARDEPAIVVRRELAAAARRWPADRADELLAPLVGRNEDAGDRMLPLLLWWAVESHCMDDPARYVRLISSDPLRQSAIVKDVILPRVVRRLAADGSERGWLACSDLLNRNPDRSIRKSLEAELLLGLAYRPFPQSMSGDLFSDVAIQSPRGSSQDAAGRPTAGPAAAALMECLGLPDPTDTVRLAIELELGDPSAVDRALQRAGDRSLAEALRVSALGALHHAPPARIPAGRILELFRDRDAPAVQIAALEQLGRTDDRLVMAELMAVLSVAVDPLRSRVMDVLVSRPHWIPEFLAAVEEERIASADVSLDRVRRMSALGDSVVQGRIRRIWGNISPGTPEEKLAEMRRLMNDLNAGPGDAEAGKALFQMHCGTCHRLKGTGNQIGPDLTTANRADRSHLLASLVDPSAVVRREFLSYVAQTVDGRVVEGVVVEEDSMQVVLAGVRGERHVVRRAELESLESSGQSLMPEQILKPLSPQELRNLFQFLEQP